MKHRLSWLFGLGLTSILLLVAATPAGAAGPSQIDGVQTLVTYNDPYNPADDVFWMDGYGSGRPALIGYWYIRSFVLGVFTPSGVITGTGTEEFVGCYDANGDRQCGTAEPSGSLQLSYQATVKLDPLTFTQVLGRCHHPITGGTGDFEGATGVLRFKDDPANGCSYYSGHFTLDG